MEDQHARIGRYIETTTAGEVVRAYVPKPLPPTPAIRIQGLLPQLSAADQALGRLDGVSVLLPRQDLFLYMYVRKEAVLSSQIEGTKSSLSDLLLFELDEAPGVPLDDVVEVSNYVAATEHGLARLRDGFPLSNRLLSARCTAFFCRAGAERTSSRASSADRKTGSAAADRTTPTSSRPRLNGFRIAWERWRNFSTTNRCACQRLVKAALAHVQFETIHPFLDGNGRVGRLLITLCLCSQKVLHEPMLYLSLYLKHAAPTTMRLLQEVRETGAWEAWLDFFLNGVASTANQAFDAATRIHTLMRQDRERIAARSDRASSVLRVHEVLQTSPFLTAATAGERTGLTKPTINAAFAELQRLSIVDEITNKRRGRVYAYRDYLAILNEGGERLDDASTRKAATLSGRRSGATGRRKRGEP